MSYHHSNPLREICRRHYLSIAIKSIPLRGILLRSFLFVILTVTHATIQAQPLSPTASASVITCGPGNDFYTTFGHSAIHITDTARGIDHVYNYGTFDFDTPHFYLKFFRGRLDYCLSRSSFQHFMAVYDYERRWVCEQRLDFTPQEVNNLYLMLEWNYLPENRYYRYDFFRDNCATRVRDMVEAAAGHDGLQLPAADRRTYRRYIHAATAGGRLEWWTLGVDLLLGLPADHRCSAAEAMFYPTTMMQLYDGATLGNRPLTLGNRQLLSDTRPPLRRSISPLAVFGLLLSVVALLTAKRRWPRWADRVLFCLAGIVGLFLCFMWFGTDHYCTAWNLHLLWASPLLILIAIRLDKSPKWALWLQEACFLTAALWVLVCGLSPAFIPLILTLALRTTLLLITPHS